MTARRLLFAVTAVAFLAPAPARAIPNTCPTTGPDAGTVNIAEPLAGTSVAGQVTVRGRASAAAGLSRVEVFVGEALKDFQIFEPPRTDVDFLLQFDVASVQTSTVTLSVVACGGPPDAAVRGIASINVLVNGAVAVTAPPMALTPSERTDDPAGARSGAGPAWVGAVFGIAGLIGLVAATRGVRGARGASAPSSGPETAGAGQARSLGRDGRPPEVGGAPPPPPIPSPRQAAVGSGATAGRPRRSRFGGDDGWPARRRRGGWPR